MTTCAIDLSCADINYKGGVSRFCNQLSSVIAKDLSNGGHDVYVVCNKYNIEFYRKLINDVNINYIVVDIFGKRNLKNFIIALISYILRSVKLYICLVNYVHRKYITELKKRGVVKLYCPTSTLNVFPSFVDCYASIHDLQHEVAPENFTLPTRVARWASYKATMLFSKGIQVSSQAALNEINCITGGLFRDKLFVVNEFYSPEFANKSLFIEQAQKAPYAFYPAQYWPHKNHKFLIEAISAYNLQSSARLKLICSGNAFAKESELYNLSARMSLDFEHVGMVSDEELIELYNHAEIVIIPTAYESSSLPIIESFALKKIVLASNIPPILEFFDRYTGVTFELDNVESFVNALNYAMEKKKSLIAQIEKETHLFIKNYSVSSVSEKYINAILQ